MLFSFSKNRAFIATLLATAVGLSSGQNQTAYCDWLSPYSSECIDECGGDSSVCVDDWCASLPEAYQSIVYACNGNQAPTIEGVVDTVCSYLDSNTASCIDECGGDAASCVSDFCDQIDPQWELLYSACWDGVVPSPDVWCLWIPEPTKGCIDECGGDSSACVVDYCADLPDNVRPWTYACNGGVYPETDWCGWLNQSQKDCVDECGGDSSACLVDYCSSLTPIVRQWVDACATDNVNTSAEEDEATAPEDAPVTMPADPDVTISSVEESGTSKSAEGIVILAATTVLISLSTMSY